MEIITRKEALSNGLKHYFTGLPCKYGHVVQRYVGRGNCLECQKGYKLIWNKNNKEKMRIDKAEYYKNNKEHLKKYGVTWNKNNKQKKAENEARYAKENPGIVNAITAKRRAAKLNATVPWGDQDAIKRMYIVADFLTNKLGEPHHVDHIIPLQGKNVCGLHVETNLQVIPAKDNLVKSNKFNDGE